MIRRRCNVLPLRAIRGIVQYASPDPFRRPRDARPSLLETQGPSTCMSISVRPSFNEQQRWFAYSASRMIEESVDSGNSSPSITTHIDLTTSPTYVYLDAHEITIAGVLYSRDSSTNIPSSIASAASRRIHHVPTNPVAIFRRMLESHFARSHENVFTTFDDLHPVVTPGANFDSLHFPADHPSRGPGDTYFVNSDLILRTHTSAHQAQLLEKGHTDFLVTADVYRRDEIDRSHYPAFHQMEGVRTFPRDSLPPKPYLDADPRFQLVDETTSGSAANPIQPSHTPHESALVAADLKRAVNGMLLDLFGPLVAAVPGGTSGAEPLKIRWVDAYFPFTAPSYEVEVWYQGKWLEVLGSGVMRQEILDNAGLPNRLGWAFGLGIERLAMVLFRIPDIRLFWSNDPRFLGQFSEGRVTEFRPYSRYPACYKDLSFWLPKAETGENVFVENDFMEVVRDVAGDLVEDVSLASVDEFINSKTNRTSRCYRINYRSMDRNLTNEEINGLHQTIETRAAAELKVQVRIGSTSQRISRTKRPRDNDDSVDALKEVEMGGKRTYNRRPKPDPKAPRKPPSSYVEFCSLEREALRRKFGDEYIRRHTFQEISKSIAEKWRTLGIEDPELKKRLDDRAKEAREKYDKELFAYQQTDDFKRYQAELDEWWRKNRLYANATDLDKSLHNSARGLDSLKSSAPDIHTLDLANPGIETTLATADPTALGSALQSVLESSTLTDRAKEKLFETVVLKQFRPSNAGDSTTSKEPVEIGSVPKDVLGNQPAEQVTVRRNSSSMRSGEVRTEMIARTQPAEGWEPAPRRRKTSSSNEMVRGSVRAKGRPKK
ncbi:hypothetical protein HDU93_007429 [Gonapodya sp. JEL0774]|nr:hypothetical protein HDU93_007429 [Gonapodya sp. JEL0774]